MSNCLKCPLYSPNLPNYVTGNGIDPPSPFMIVGEAPGKEENAQKLPFVGQSGQELGGYLKRVGIPREKWYVTNVVKCHPPKDRDPSEKEIECCRENLELELNIYSPYVIAAVGRYAVRYFLGDVDMEMVHGIPFQVDGRIIIPCYHPAYGLRDTTSMTLVQQDFEAVTKVISHDLGARKLEDDKGKEFKYELVMEPGRLRMIFCTSAGVYIAIDTESIGPSHSIPWCLTFSVSPSHGYMIMADNHKCLKMINDFVQREGKITILHNALWDLKILAQMGVYPREVKDTMIMAYLLQDKPQGLKPLAYRLLGVKMKAYEDMIPPYQAPKSLEYLKQVEGMKWPAPEQRLIWDKGEPKIKKPQSINKRVVRILADYAKDPSLDLVARWKNIEDRGVVEEKLGLMPMASLMDVPFEDALEYACRDAIVTYLVHPILSREIKARDLGGVLQRDIGIIPMVEDMMTYGMKINPDHFRELTQYFQEKMDRINKEIEGMYYQSTGKQKVININSPKQVGEVLFEMKVFKRKGQSTAADALDKYKGKFPVVDKITKYRGLSTLKGTYSSPLVEKVDENNRVHSKLRTTFVVTGRLSSSDPNLHNQPISTEEGRKIRQGFIAEEGCILLASDYSQIELRVVAHVSQDPVMMKIFHDGGDIHTQTACGMFKLDLEKIDKNLHRRPAKSVNFGIIYGLSAIGLQRDLLSQGVIYTVDQCQEFIDSWLNLYRGVRDHLDETKAFARRYGYVVNFLGRRRLIPETMSTQSRIREAGLRQAVNAPIQGGAADIIKQAMIDLTPLYREFQDMGYICRPLLQIHDELIFEVSEEIVPVIAPIIKTTMEEAVKLSIPVLVDQKIGKNWRDMEKVK